MSNTAEEILRELRESPLYKAHDLVQVEGFLSVIHWLVTQREDWALELVYSVLNRYFELQHKELPVRASEDSLVTRLRDQSTSSEDLLKSTENQMVALLAERYAEEKYLEKEGKSPWQNERPKPSDRPTSEIEEMLAEFRQVFKEGKNLEKEVDKAFPFFKTKEFRDAVKYIAEDSNDISRSAENAYKLFFVLTRLASMKNGQIDLQPTIKRKINGGTYREIQSKSRGV